MSKDMCAAASEQLERLQAAREMLHTEKEKKPALALDIRSKLTGKLTPGLDKQLSRVGIGADSLTQINSER